MQAQNVRPPVLFFDAFAHDFSVASQWPAAPSTLYGKKF
jgi:hypothetical protein